MNDIFNKGWLADLQKERKKERFKLILAKLFLGIGIAALFYITIVIALTL